MVWPPWPVGDRLLIDGGTSDPLPVDVAMKEGGDVIIAMGLEEPYAPDCRSLGELAHQTIAVVTNNLLRATYSFYNIAHHSEVIPIIPTFDRKIGTTDGHLGPYLAERGREATLAVLPQLRRLLDATTP
jgi:NTE family protein